MATLIIKNIDLDKLERQRLSLTALRDSIIDLNFFTEDSDWSEPIDSMINMLDKWSDQRYHKQLGSNENQKAKDRQQSIDWSNHSMVHQCLICGYQGGHDSCPHCNVLMEPVENVK